MKLGENKEETKGRFRWKIGIAIILLLAVAAYLIKLISPQPEEDYKKSGKFTDPDSRSCSCCSYAGRFSCLPERFGNSHGTAHGHGEITR